MFTHGACVLRMCTTYGITHACNMRRLVHMHLTSDKTHIAWSMFQTGPEPDSASKTTSLQFVQLKPL